MRKWSDSTVVGNLDNLKILSFMHHYIITHVSSPQGGEFQFSSCHCIQYKFKILRKYILHSIMI